MGSCGWIGLHWPERVGGRGGDPLETVAAEERFGYHWLPLSGYLLSVKTIGNALLGHANPDLQERLLPEIAAGRLLFCQGFSEPEAGSDLAALRTVGRRDGDRFVVSGHKIWTSSAALADWIYLAVRTGPEASRPHAGVSVLVADVRTPGIEVREIPTVGGGIDMRFQLRKCSSGGGGGRSSRSAASPCAPPPRATAPVRRPPGRPAAAGRSTRSRSRRGAPAPPAGGAG
jgi:3-oxocholest-4-en-26-oyl-CoA dehydrogenase alpha subunit